MLTVPVRTTHCRKGPTASDLRPLAESVLGQMKDLRKLLRTGNLSQGKTLLSRFVDRIEVDKTAKTAFVYFHRIPVVNNSVKELAGSECYGAVYAGGPDRYAP